MAPALAFDGRVHHPDLGARHRWGGPLAPLPDAHRGLGGDERRLAAGARPAGAREGRLGRVEHALSAAGFSWGLLFGAITNLYFWPYAQGPVSQTWSAGLSLGETLAHFGAFYAATSLPWDMARAVGNVALLVPLATPTVRALTRFRRRFRFQAGAPAPMEGVRADA